MFGPLVAMVAFGATPSARPRVTTSMGMVEGVVQNGCKVFHGVPFAAPPVKELRWVE
jgi:para-nitrobenzyl esterase